jgi:hypothetical protein
MRDPRTVLLPAPVTTASRHVPLPLVAGCGCRRSLACACEARDLGRPLGPVLPAVTGGRSIPPIGGQRLRGLDASRAARLPAPRGEPIGTGKPAAGRREEAIRPAPRLGRKDVLIPGPVPLGAPRPAPGGGLATNSVLQAAVRYGLNDAKFYRSENGGGADRKYGSYDVIADDLALLGASVARHPGDVQLFARELFSDGIVPFPVLGAEAFADNVAESERFTDLQRLVKYLADNDIPLKLYITAMTFARVTTQVPSDRRAPSGAASLRWATPYLTDPGFSSGYGTDWDLDTLGPWNSAKRGYAAMIAKGIARGLNRVKDALAKLPRPISLADYIEGIEIGNELEARDQAWNAAEGEHEPDGTSWGAFYYACAAAMIGEADWLPLKVAGLTSSTAAAERATGAAGWSTKIVFLKDFLAEVERLAGPDLAKLITGIDFHYYHRQEGEDAQRLAFLVAQYNELRNTLGGYLAISDLPITLQETGVGVACVDPPITYADTPRPDLGPAPVFDEESPPILDYDAGCEDRAHFTVLEPYDDYEAPTEPDDDFRPRIAGCSGLPDIDVIIDPDEADGWPPEADPETIVASDEPEEGYPVGYAVGPNDFQAMSVWMRFAVAASTGVAVVSWHTLMSSLDTGFSGTGLRRDLHDDTLGPEIALQRPAWWAYQRYAQLLGGASAVAALNPVVTKIEVELQDTIAAGDWKIENDVWMIQFARPIRTPTTDVQEEVETLHVPEGLPRAWAYLLFVDPYGAATCARVTLRSTASAEHTVVQVATKPREAVVDPEVADRFTSTMWVAESQHEHTMGPAIRLEVTLSVGRYPVLLFSAHELSLLHVEAT